MTWVAVAIGGSAILGGVLSSNASRQAANTQSDAANQAQQTQLQMFNTNQANLAPWMQSGQQGNQALMQWLGLGQGGQFNPNAPGVAPFNASMLPGDPSYQWRLGQGENALLNNASALGGLGGGNTQKALLNYGQNAASQQYQTALQNYLTQQGNVTSRLSGVSNTGVNAAGGIANLGANAANQISNYQTQAGNAQAAGTVGQANALTGGINNLAYLLAGMNQGGGFGGFGAGTSAPALSFGGNPLVGDFSSGLG